MCCYFGGLRELDETELPEYYAQAYERFRGRKLKLKKIILKL